MNKEQKAKLDELTKVAEGDFCPHCKIGKMVVKIGKYGNFLACDCYPSCAFTRRIKSEDQSL